MRLHAATVVVALTVVLAGPPARAEPTANDQSLAQSLFEQGKKLMGQERYAEACSKLQESQRLDPSGGTVLNLALCREREGKLATAWADFKTALSFARRDGRQDRVGAAEEHIAKLEPRLPKLTVEALDPAKKQKISIDETELRQGAWGIPMAVDPGSHVIHAEAPGKKPWETTIEIAVAARETVEVPALATDEAAAGEAVSTPAIPADRGADRASGRRTLGWVLGGTGIAAIGVGSYFGVRALDKRSQSDKLCPTDNTCTSEGVSLNNEAKTAAWIADVGIGVGIVGIGVGTYLLLTSKSSSGSEADTARTGPRFSFDAAPLPGGGRVTIGGGW